MRTDRTVPGRFAWVWQMRGVSADNAAKMGSSAEDCISDKDFKRLVQIIVTYLSEEDPMTRSDIFFLAKLALSLREKILFGDKPEDNEA